MKGCFIRLLFGDALIDRREAVVREVSLSRQFPQPEPLVFWAMGQENLRIAKEAGWDARLLCEEPVLNFTGQTERHPERLCGFLPYGTNVFHAKFLALAETIKLGYDQAVFLDLDIGMVEPLPTDFWQRLEVGREIQTELRTYHRRICRWRKEGQRTVCWAAAIYVRGLPICERLLSTAQAHPEWFEQWVMSLMTDEMLGGWTSIEAFKAAGFFFPYLDQRNLSLSSAKAVFRALLSKGYSPMTKHPAKWAEYVSGVSQKASSV